ncbi:hypothetical protein ACQP2T_30040 [Nonomuraea sp. CA-143628]|uniref:hypothetical protein n=1 Tax=Nonomuraea sp. CA-143628 TaxID=3239997 RepID=UPI003D8D26A9
MLAELERRFTSPAANRLSGELAAGGNQATAVIAASKVGALHAAAVRNRVWIWTGGHRLVAPGYERGRPGDAALDGAGVGGEVAQDERLPRAESSRANPLLSRRPGRRSAGIKVNTLNS